MSSGGPPGGPSAAGEEAEWSRLGSAAAGQTVASHLPLWAAARSAPGATAPAPGRLRAREPRPAGELRPCAGAGRGLGRREPWHHRRGWRRRGAAPGCGGRRSAGPGGGAAAEAPGRGGRRSGRAAGGPRRLGAGPGRAGAGPRCGAARRSPPQRSARSPPAAPGRWATVGAARPPRAGQRRRREEAEAEEAAAVGGLGPSPGR